MGNLQKTLNSLQPFLIGIRYLDGHPVVDVIFKDGWLLLESDDIKRVKGDEGLNYYMLFSEKENIGLDELLEYVELVIKNNIEREKKHELLKEKVNELKELFKKTSLLNLKKLKFSFTHEELIPELEDFDLTEEINTTMINSSDTSELDNNSINSIEQTTKIQEQSDINQEEYNDEESEIIAEEQRAEIFRKIKEKQAKNSQIKKLSHNIELPPRNINQNISNTITDCDCGSDEACSKCIEEKDL